MANQEVVIAIIAQFLDGARLDQVFKRIFKFFEDDISIGSVLINCVVDYTFMFQNVWFVNYLRKKLYSFLCLSLHQQDNAFTELLHEIQLWMDFFEIVTSRLKQMINRV